ncbi:hypothetical protein SDC9_162348 [bioreactor metagenome]|uniref:Uncharacterized protein n=1 Tax=bioreactor metagenome TaxID=1076179 RepID=A0A645FNU7_9ZZZZ
MLTNRVKDSPIHDSEYLFSIISTDRPMHDFAAVTGHLAVQRLGQDDFLHTFCVMLFCKVVQESGQRARFQRCTIFFCQRDGTGFNPQYMLEARWLHLFFHFRQNGFPCPIRIASCVYKLSLRPQDRVLLPKCNL